MQQSGEDDSELREKVKELKQKQKQMDADVDQVKLQLDRLVSRIGNYVHDSVPGSKLCSSFFCHIKK